jgi:hypothetical protein
MEMSQGNSLHSYLNPTKMSFYFIFLQNCRTSPVWGKGGGYQWKGGGCGEAWEGEYGANTCTHVCKCKMRPVDMIPGMGGREKAVKGRNSSMIYYIFDTL